MADIEGADPALLAEREGDEEAQLDQLRLGEVLVELRPEGVVGQRRVEENRLGVGQRDLLALAEPLRLAEVEQVGVLVLG